MIGLPTTSFLGAILPPYLAAVVIAAGVRAIAADFFPEAAPLFLVAGMSLGYLLLMCVVYWFAFPDRVRELWATLRTTLQPTESPSGDWGRTQ
jgi:hypothetical protein